MINLYHRTETGVLMSRIIRQKTNTLQNFEVKKDHKLCGLAREIEVLTNGYTFRFTGHSDDKRLCGEYTMKNLDLDVEPMTLDIGTVKILLECITEQNADIKVIRE